jgi:hypothetical protein
MNSAHISKASFKMDSQNNISAFMHGNNAIHYGSMLADCQGVSEKRRFINDQFEYHVSRYCDMLVEELKMIEKGGNESLPGFIVLHFNIIPLVISDLSLLRSKESQDYYYSVLEGVFLPLIPSALIAEQLNLTIENDRFSIKKISRQALEVERRDMSISCFKKTITLAFKALLLFITSKHI